MSVTLRLTGLEELKAALLKLPAEFHAEGFGYVKTATDGSAADLRAAYSAVQKSGKLARGVTTEYPSTTVAVGRVRSRAKHSHLYEYGTQVRRTAQGWNRGAGPAHPTAIPIFRRRRDTLRGQLIAMVRRAGLTVTGDVG